MALEPLQRSRLRVRLMALILKTFPLEWATLVEQWCCHRLETAKRKEFVIIRNGNVIAVNGCADDGMVLSYCPFCGEKIERLEVDGE